MAIAWVQQRAGVTSTIIGARTLEQLDANLAALDVKLTPEQAAVLEKLSAPALNFPAPFLRNAPMFMHGGLTVNGVAGGPNMFAPAAGQKRW